MIILKKEELQRRQKNYLICKHESSLKTVRKEEKKMKTSKERKSFSTQTLRMKRITFETCIKNAKILNHKKNDKSNEFLVKL